MFSDTVVTVAGVRGLRPFSDAGSETEVLSVAAGTFLTSSNTSDFSGSLDFLPSAKEKSSWTSDDSHDEKKSK